jgi:hypothetical protein
MYWGIPHLLKGCFISHTRYQFKLIESMPAIGNKSCAHSYIFWSTSINLVYVESDVTFYVWLFFFWLFRFVFFFLFGLEVSCILLVYLGFNPSALFWNKLYLSKIYIYIYIPRSKPQLTKLTLEGVGHL